MNRLGLTENQQILLRTLVKCDDEGRLPEKGFVHLMPGDDKYLLHGCKIELASTADLDALCDIGLLESRIYSPHPVYRITDAGRKAVEDAPHSPPAGSRIQCPAGCRFFITHSSKDGAFAQTLYDDLRRHGFDGFLDSDSIRPGDKIPGKINRGLEDCDLFLPILSFASLQSRWCEDEISAALMRNNAPEQGGRPRIIPILIDECQDEVPWLLRIRRYISFAGRYDEAIEELLASLSDSKSSATALGSNGSTPAVRSPTAPMSSHQWDGIQERASSLIRNLENFRSSDPQAVAVSASMPYRRALTQLRESFANWEIYIAPYLSEEERTVVHSIGQDNLGMKNLAKGEEVMRIRDIIFRFTHQVTCR